MDIEQLKLILTTVGKLGTDSKEAFFWWVFAKEVFPYLVGLIWACGLGVLVRFIVVKISNASEMQQLKNHFGFSDYTNIKDILNNLTRK